MYIEHNCIQFQNKEYNRHVRIHTKLFLYIYHYSITVYRNCFYNKYFFLDSSEYFNHKTLYKPEHEHDLNLFKLSEF